MGFLVAVHISHPQLQSRTARRLAGCGSLMLWDVTIDALIPRSPAPSQEFLDRIVDSFFITYLGEGKVGNFVKSFLELPVEFARAVGALDLSVAEKVALGQELIAQEVDAVTVIFAPVVAIGEVEHVNVPIERRVELVDELVGQRVG